MNPNPRSDTIFFTVPFGIARSPPLEHRMERIGPVRERRMPAAREVTRRPSNRAVLYHNAQVRRIGDLATQSTNTPPPSRGRAGWGQSAPIGRQLQAEANQGQAGDRFEG